LQPGVDAPPIGAFNVLGSEKFDWHSTLEPEDAYAIAFECVDQPTTEFKQQSGWR
jgi:hypothetical protein